MIFFNHGMLLLGSNHFLINAFTIDKFFCFLSLFLESETWNSYVLTHVKDTITEPLTTLPSKELEKEALRLFKVCYNLKFP